MTITGDEMIREYRDYVITEDEKELWYTALEFTATDADGDELQIDYLTYDNGDIEFAIDLSAEAFLLLKKKDVRKLINDLENFIKQIKERLGD